MLQNVITELKVIRLLQRWDLRSMAFGDKGAPFESIGTAHAKSKFLYPISLKVRRNYARTTTDLLR